MSRVIPARAAPLPPATRLQLMWLASPALPVGGFSYSEGLEAAVDAGLVSNEAQAAQWFTDQIRLSLARSDLAVVAKAIAAWVRGDLARVQELNEWVTLTRETSELCLQSEQMGRSLCEWLRNRSGDLHALTQDPQKNYNFDRIAEHEMKILVIEDEEKLASYLKKGLTSSGYITEVANDGVTGLHLSLENDYA